MVATMQVVVQDHCFLVGDASEASPRYDLLDWSSGIAGTMPTALLIDAGIQSGTVTVSAAVCDERPPLEADHQWGATTEWDDIAEVSVDVPGGMLTLAQLHYSTGAEPPPPPILSTSGPGSYRLRLHAFGRDQQYDQVVDNSAVRLHIIVWPEPITAPLIIKSTSRCGYGLRVSEHHRVVPAESPTPPSAQQEQADRDALIRRTLEEARRTPNY
ncbi:hypothetical protein [Actinoplanes sp. NPDC026670]|uniref:hypothetical protein n=1 Tax=Actinoplanes sp. NPDC026670 TaxID=3154700 RepID=UPI0033F232F5